MAITKLQMKWDNGTVTTVAPIDGRIVVSDSGETITNGKKMSSYTVDEAMALIDEHEQLNLLLRIAVQDVMHNRKEIGDNGGGAGFGGKTGCRRQA